MKIVQLETTNVGELYVLTDKGEIYVLAQSSKDFAGPQGMPPKLWRKVELPKEDQRNAN